MEHITGYIIRRIHLVMYMVFSMFRSSSFRCIEYARVVVNTLGTLVNFSDCVLCFFILLPHMRKRTGLL